MCDEQICILKATRTDKQLKEEGGRGGGGGRLERGEGGLRSKHNILLVVVASTSFLTSRCPLFLLPSFQFIAKIITVVTSYTISCTASTDLPSDHKQCLFAEMATIHKGKEQLF